MWARKPPDRPMALDVQCDKSSNRRFRLIALAIMVSFSRSTAMCDPHASDRVGVLPEAPARTCLATCRCCPRRSREPYDNASAPHEVHPPERCHALAEILIMAATSTPIMLSLKRDSHRNRRRPTICAHLALPQQPMPGPSTQGEPLPSHGLEREGQSEGSVVVGSRYCFPNVGASSAKGLC
jgi:hypothetical protein